MEYDFEEMLLYKLHNSARGSAQSILSDKQLSDEERKRRFEIIEQLIQYVDNYRQNKQKLKEYDFWQRNLVDDGR